MGTGSVVEYDWPAFKRPLWAKVPSSIGEERLDEAEAKTSSFQVVATVSPVPWLATVHDRRRDGPGLELRRRRERRDDQVGRLRRDRDRARAGRDLAGQIDLVDRVAAVGVGDHVIGPGQAIGDREGHLVGVRATGVERTGVGRRPDRDLRARVQGRSGREVEGIGPRHRHARPGGHQGRARRRRSRPCR